MRVLYAAFAIVCLSGCQDATSKICAAAPAAEAAAEIAPTVVHVSAKKQAVIMAGAAALTDLCAAAQVK